MAGSIVLPSINTMVQKQCPYRITNKWYQSTPLDYTVFRQHREFIDLMPRSTIILSVDIKYSMCDVTVHSKLLCVSCEAAVCAKWCQRSIPLVSALRIPRLGHNSKEIHVKNFLISIFFCSYISIAILSFTLVLPISQLQAQQLMASHYVMHRIFNTNWCFCDTRI